MIAATVLGIVAASFLLTGLARWYALRRQLIDLPNHRSSHVRPTVRGGGVGFALCLLPAFWALYQANVIERELAFGLLGAGLLVAAIGFADDHRHVPAVVRLAVQVAAAIWLVVCLGVPFAAAGASEWVAALWGVVTVVGIVWFTNLYNFMDGIDGLAGSEALTVCLGVAGIASAVLPQSGASVASVLVAAAVAGFLAWNWPPARIFMGDVGSGFLGVAIAGLALHAAVRQPSLFSAWVILTGVFVVDATLTLLRRALNGRALHVAHRSHAYQHAALLFGHKRVVLAVGALNVFWLLPLAGLVASGRLSAPLGIVVAYLPLAALAASFRAGLER